jgi:hypothetical protein
MNLNNYRYIEIDASGRIVRAISKLHTAKDLRNDAHHEEKEGLAFPSFFL